MEHITNIECECEFMDSPVSAFGDFLCKPSNSSVRDMIRRFEGGEAPDSFGMTTSSQSTTIKIPENYASDKFLERRVVYEEQLPMPQRAMQTIQEYFSKRYAIRLRDRISEKKSLFENNIVKSINQQKPQGSFIGRNPFIKDTENVTYPSKTTICKTDFGVRIIVDINFDTRAKLESWQGSRIETDIPSSEILTEFQKK